MTTPPLSREEADRILVGLDAAHDEVAAAMYRVDSHPGLAFLRGGAVSGASAALWADLKPRIDLLWAHFTVFGEVLEQAQAVRDRRGRPGDAELGELALLLRAATIGLDANGLPSDGTAGPAARYLAVTELVPALQGSCTAVLAELTAVDAAVRALSEDFERLEHTLAEVREQATALGETDELGNELVVRLARTRTQLLFTDPVGAAPGGVVGPAAQQRLAALGTELTAARDRLAGMAALRDAFDDRFAALNRTIEEVGAAEREAAEAYRSVQGKIHDPRLPALPGGAAGLRATTTELRDLHRGARWTRLGERFGAVERDAAAAADRARRLRDAATGLLARRDELRGRLDAYHAKAGRRGLAEHAGLAARHEEAHRLLYTAPCDLPAATRAVFGYQQLLAEVLGQPTSGTRE
jgi:hypothetical protein